MSGMVCVVVRVCKCKAASLRANQTAEFPSPGPSLGMKKTMHACGHCMNCSVVSIASVRRTLEGCTPGSGFSLGLPEAASRGVYRLKIRYVNACYAYGINRRRPHRVPILPMHHHSVPRSQCQLYLHSPCMRLVQDHQDLTGPHVQLLGLSGPRLLPVEPCYYRLGQWYVCT